jgi:hypothetical protein
MKTILLLLLIPLFSYSQTYNQLAINLQSGYNTHNSVNGSIMIGVQASNQTQGFIGVMYKRFNNTIGHSSNYIGLKAHVQSSIESTGVTPYLEVYAIRGQYFTYAEINDSIASVQKGIQIGGTVGIGYMINDNIGLFSGYSINDYNPENYYNKGKSPYNKGSFSFKVSYSIPLSFGFNAGNQQRRMY